ncbi:hypothetical protein GQ600_20470 [Phytophthora cactorum]|nr:hypothetical protein GQ600_20470 [Phytophthora cactorum]
MLAQAKANYREQGMFGATPRIAEAADAIDSNLAKRPDARAGDIARSHRAIIQARQPDEASASMPESGTFRQMPH